MPAYNLPITSPGGVQRYADFVSMMPDFMGQEQSVVDLIQLFSDYINNAYRNITYVDEFRFMLISVDGNLTAIKDKCERMRKVFAECEDRKVPLVLMGLPQGNAKDATRPTAVGHQDINQSYDTIASDIGEIDAKYLNPALKNDMHDGDKVFLNFTTDDSKNKSAFFTYDAEKNILFLDSTATYLDPFKGSYDRDISTDMGWMPRMLEFKVKDVSTRVNVKPATAEDNDYTYEISFTAIVYDIEDVSSIEIKSRSGRETLVDYYGLVNPVPSRFMEVYSVDFADGCPTFLWSGTEGHAIIYARDLTSNDSTTGNTSTEFIDPTLGDNYLEYIITRTEAARNHKLTVYTQAKHGVQIGDYITITGNSRHDGYLMKVLDVTGKKSFVVESLGTGSGYGGRAIKPNLWFSRTTDHPTKNYYLLSYDKKWGSYMPAEKDVFYRAFLDMKTEYLSIVPKTDINVSAQGFRSSQIDGIAVGDMLLPLVPAGASEEMHSYGIDNLVPVQIVSETQVSNERYISLANVAFPTVPTGTTEVTFVKLTRYFHADEHTFDYNRSTQGLPVNDTDGLEVGDFVVFEPLNEGSILSGTAVYEIERIRQGAIVLKDFRYEDFPENTNEWYNIHKISTEDSDFIVTLDSRIGVTGRIRGSQKLGDLITSGYFFFHRNHDALLLQSKSTATPWNELTNKPIKKGDSVSFHNLHYRCLRTHIGGNIGLDNNEYFEIDMEPFLEPYKVPKYNPNMFGLFNLIPLDYNENPDYSMDLAYQSRALYIKKEQDLSLKFGDDAQSFIYTRPAATNETTDRSGFLSVTNTEELFGHYRSYTSSGVSEKKLTYGVTDIVLPILSAYVQDGTCYVSLASEHGFSSGIFVRLDGLTSADGSAQGINGRWEIQVTSENTFTCEPEASDGVYNVMGATATYNHASFARIANLYTQGGKAYAITSEAHGFQTGIEITVSGVDDPDKQYYNTTATLTRVNDMCFSYPIVSNNPQDPTDTTEVFAMHRFSVGEFINLDHQGSDSANGIFVVENGRWSRAPGDRVSKTCTVFSPRNFFTIGGHNDTVATLKPVDVISATYNINHTVSVKTDGPHNLHVGDAFYMTGATEDAYTGRYIVNAKTSDTSFSYKIPFDLEPGPVAVPYYAMRIQCAEEAYFKYSIALVSDQSNSDVTINEAGSPVSLATNNEFGRVEITLGEKVIFVPGDVVFFEGNSELSGNHVVTEVTGPFTFTIMGTLPLDGFGGYVFRGLTVPERNGVNNIPSLYGGLSITLDGIVRKFNEGMIAHLHDQLDASENGYWIVHESKYWERLGPKASLNVWGTKIDSYTDPEMVNEDYPIIYKTYSRQEVLEHQNRFFTMTNNVFVLGLYDVPNWNFPHRTVENMDSSHDPLLQYDAKKDYNSVVPESDKTGGFFGVQDMRYPLLEKFERLAYLKDPEVIDFEMVQFIARLMGYNLTSTSQDIEESLHYNTREEVNGAIRSAISSLPQFGTLKSTKSSIEMMLATFGIVGEVITLWTDASNPYVEFLEETDVQDRYLDASDNGLPLVMSPTPHFKVKVELENPYKNRIDGDNIPRIELSITQIKPINTVYDGLIAYIRAEFDIDAYISGTRMSAKEVVRVGFEPKPDSLGDAYTCENESWSVGNDEPDPLVPPTDEPDDPTPVRSSTRAKTRT
jgi:hypothetical protein